MKIITDFHHHDIRHNILDPIGVISVTGLGSQLANELDSGNRLFQRRVQFFRHTLKVALIEPFEIVLDNLPGQRFFNPQVIELYQQTLLQVAGADAGGVKRLNHLQYAFNRGHADVKRRRNLF